MPNGVAEFVWIPVELRMAATTDFWRNQLR